MAEDEQPIETIDESELENAETKNLVPSSTGKTGTNHISGETKPPKQQNIIQKIVGAYKTKKKLAFPLTAIAVLVVLYAVPLTRYTILGLVIKHDISVTIKDIQTLTPISGVEVSAHGKSAKTDAEGRATIKNVKIGRTKLTARKKYYKDFSEDITITVVAAKGSGELRLQATGRQVPVQVINKITGQSVEGATVKATDTEVQTDKNGLATLVLPPAPGTVSGTISAKGYNNETVQINIFPEKPDNSVFAITPIGKVYFLSKKSGKIDVVKTDLDGSNRQTVLAGTGQEEDTNTVLLASRDWKYLALQSRRESDKSRLYMIDTSNDKLTEMDSGDATFTPVGWHDHYFTYKVNRNSVLVWQPKATALKTFNAENLQLNTVDETNAEGSGDSDYATESIDNIYILKDGLVYTKRWYAGYYSIYRLAGKRMGIYTTKLGGTGRQIAKDFDAGNNSYISAVLSKPDEVYFSITGASTSYYEYANGSVKQATDINNESFSKFYPTYLASPGGQDTFWYEPRDGKNTLLTGTQDGSNPKEIASLSEYIPYGWYSDNYLLVSKNSSELFILPATGAGDKGQVLKISDYHKPNVNFAGYGGGYGGF